MKIQYPGVAEGMESDIKNLMSLLKFWKALPDGIFIDNMVREVLLRSDPIPFSFLRCVWREKNWPGKWTIFARPSVRSDIER